MSFSLEAIDACERYYDHLDKQGKGIAKNPVIDIKSYGKGYYELWLTNPIKLDIEPQIQIDGKIYTEKEIRAVKYDRIRSTMLIRVQEDLCPLIDSVRPEQVCTVSDLKFLVKRVQTWYEKYGSRISLPKNGGIGIDDNCLPEHASDDQKKALQMICTEPLSYVWGAPGTGKTKMVLAHAVLRYIEEGKRVLVTAPTNNALEQTLYGMLPKLTENGIDIEKEVLRMGAASEKFMNEYSCVCEDKRTALRIKELSDQNEQEQKRLKELRELLTGLKNYLEFAEKYEKARTVIPKCYERITQLHNEYECTIQHIEYLEIELRETNKKKIDIERQITEAERRVIHANSEVQRCSAGLMRVFGRKSRELAEKNLKERRAEVEFRKKALNEHQQAADNLEIDLRTSKNELEQKWKMMLEQRTIIGEEKAKLDLSSLHSAIEKADQELSHSYEIIQEYFIDFDERLDKKRKKYDGKKEQDIERSIIECENCITDIDEKRKALSINSAEARLEKCHVVAATPDTIAGRLSPIEGYLPEHIFIDEAGYAALIKGAMMTAFECPITLLGDHMQLPPVCEMSDDEIKMPLNYSCVLWAQSSIYAEQIETGSILEILDDYLFGESPEFRKMKKCSLVKNYRFGKKLADVLAENVYHRPLIGNDAKATKILICDVTRMPESAKWQNRAEAEAISNYIHQNPYKDMGILTPYRNQRKLIKEELKKKHLNSENVITIHGSQGREWETVLVSVTDADGKFLTNSDWSTGRKLINTAVSRAKTELILFCDMRYWSTMKKQLICKLIEIGERL